MNLGTLEHLDPQALQLEGNVRDDAALTKPFLASIAENGVLVPVTAVRTAEGTLVVRTGQRRTLAAREAGLKTIPVYVHDDGNRLVEQIVENDHRTGLTEAQRVRGIQQILDDGLSVTGTAKKLSIPAATVKAAKAVAFSATAMEALASHQFTLSEAAASVEFDGDEAALARLISAAGRPQFEHVVAQLREDRKLAAVEQEWRDRGFTTLSEPPPPRGQGIPMIHLRKDGEPVTDEVVTDPTHWAVWLCQDDVLTDKETGEQVDECEVDWNTELHPDVEPDEGLRHVNTVVESTVYMPRYWCLDPEGAGLTVAEVFAKAAAQVEPPAEKAEADKRERRKVIALNRLGEAALLVRREFVIRLLARKTAPKGAAAFVARALVTDGYLLTSYKAHEVTPELLGTGVEGLKEMVAGAGDARAQVLTLGLVLGALESRTGKDAWRTSHGYGQSLGSPGYLKFLAEQGYTLAPIEEAITGAKTSDEVFEAWLAEVGK